MYIISILSPVSIFLAYFFNACLAHNLYITFYTYKNDFHKRIYVYKITALVLSIVIFFISLIFNNRNNLTTVKFSVSYYPIVYLGFFYLLGGALCLYIIAKIFYVHSKKEELFYFLNQGNCQNRKELISLFLKKHISYLISFLICFFPNNIILIIQIFSYYKICNDCQYYSIVIYLMSSSCLITFMIKLTEPYMQKYLKLIVNFLYKRKFGSVKIYI